MASLQLPPSPASHEETLARVTCQLSQQGLQVVQSFDLQATNALCANRHCPTYTVATCQCQLTVFLVYGSARLPVTLLAHRRDHQTWFSLVNTPQQPADPELEAVITAALARSSSVHQV